MSYRKPLVVVMLLLAAPVPRAVADDKTGPQPAVIRVLIQEKAQLLFDDHVTKQTGTERVFITPPLELGKVFRYTLKATWDDGRRNIVRMAVAKVQADKETIVDLRPDSKDASSSQVVYVPTPEAVVLKMLEMAKVTKDDVVFDLGCGDGRLVVIAAKKYKAKGVGIDIDPERIKDSLANVKKEAVGDLVEIRQGDALKVADLERATVVTLYMLPEFMEKLKPILLARLKPGTRIVSHDYTLPGWEAESTVTVTGTPRIFPHTLRLWTVPERRKD